jgi:SAM-dependent methyltransferase
MRNIYPELYSLYKLFFQCKELSVQDLSKWFSQQQADMLIRDGIISCTNGRCICNYRFAPIDDLLIIGSPDCEYDTVDYVYIGGDSVRFWNLLKKSWRKSVKDALEIGCGTGFLSLWMSQIAQNVTATDISKRALEFTRLNAEMNGINNIVAKVSDVYSNIEGDFDLIISNPPFIFLPDECVGRTYAFGGDFGVEILRKILVGLDDHLRDNGVSFLTAMSYIKENGVNPVYELIKSIFHGKLYSIRLKQLDYQPLGRHYSFYKQHGISHCILYFIKIQKARAYELTDLAIRGPSKLMEYLKIRLLDQPKWKH